MRKKIIYIAAVGLSGTTLLDTVLGSREGVFSAGELIFFVKNGLLERQLCACGVEVPDCEVWSEVEKEWNRQLSPAEYTEISKQVQSKKSFFKIRKKLASPDPELSLFLKDTKALYDAIYRVTGCHTIVDSSKAPLRMLLLRELGFDVTVIHMTRRFGDVLNSNKKSAKKDLSIGREAEVVPRKTSRVFVDWILKNATIAVLSSSFTKVNVKYEELVLNTDQTLRKLTDGDAAFMEKLKNRGPFIPRHLVAGNKVRMLEDLWIAERPMNSSYSRLSVLDKAVALPMDQLYKLLPGYTETKK